MAKRRKKSTQATRTVNRTQIVRTPAPIVKVTQARAPAVRRRSSRRRVGGGGGGGGGIRSLVNPALAGGGVGLLVKSGMIDKLPEIPVVGRIGAAAIALKFFGGGSALVNDMAKGCAFLAGYQMTTEGKIHGDAGTPGDYVDSYADE